MMTPILFLVFLVSPPVINAATDPAYEPEDHIRLSCGSISLSNIWKGDESTALAPYFRDQTITNRAYEDQTTVDPTKNTDPYLYARIIRSKFTYFMPVPITYGQKILRLYFYPSTYTHTLDPAQKFDAKNSFFDVTANKYTLLSNFSAFAAVKGGKPATKSPYLVKEFIINLETRSLNLTFVPSPGSFAFINGIELLSLPENLYMGRHDPTRNKRRLIFVNAPNTQFTIDQENTAFETMTRVGMGLSKPIARVDDTGMFREWALDDDFIVSAGKGNPISNNSISLTYDTEETQDKYAAPAIVYKTARAMGRMASEKPPVNLTWSFQVDSGYTYLLRLHFCEFQPSLFFKSGQRVFNVFVDGMEGGAVDVVYFAGGTGIPMFRDYVVLIANPNGAGRVKYDLHLSLSPDFESGPQYLDAFVNAVEVFKLSTTDGYLAGVNPPV